MGQFATKEDYATLELRVQALEAGFAAVRASLNKMLGVTATTQVDVEDVKKEVHEIKNILSRMEKNSKRK